MQIIKRVTLFFVILSGIFLMGENFDTVGVVTAILFVLGIFITRTTSLPYRKYLYILVFLVASVACFFHYQIILSACPDRNVVHYGQIPSVPCIEGPEGTELYGVNLNLEYLLSLINSLFSAIVAALGIGIIVHLFTRNKDEGTKIIEAFISAFAIIFSIFSMCVILLNSIDFSHGAMSSNTWLTSGFVARGRASVDAQQERLPESISNIKEKVNDVAMISTTTKKVFSDYGISFLYPNQFKSESNFFEWNGSSGGYMINFGINDIAGMSNRQHGFLLQYPSNVQELTVKKEESLEDVEIKGVHYKKIISDTPYYKRGYVKIFYIDPIKKTPLYEFNFDYAGTSAVSYYKNKEEMEGGIFDILNSVVIDESYDHSKMMQVLLNKSPIIKKVVAPESVKIGQSIAMNIDATDQDKDTITYVVEWGDEADAGDIAHPLGRAQAGFASQNSTGMFQHSYQKQGVYTVHIYVFDKYSSRKGDNSEKTVTIQVSQ
jgi:hypothetical protein